MAELIAVTYDDVDTAVQVRETLLGLQRENLIQLADLVVAERRPDGAIELRQSQSTTGTGAAGGALWGGLIGLIFFMPLLGMAVGAASGSTARAVTDIGVDDDFMRDLAEALRPGAAAVFMILVSASRDKIAEQLAPYGGSLVATRLSREAERQLKEALAVARSAHR
ncbi:DUF1269 domain-containing protein [Spongiactinospora sp. TRM90649]|uniref:DUF1269 domain-containing protein n=1 Tax=Spongiactinospora sp. TRM90649 TaxID=3031114 RepID=UPI0023F9DBE6|nr:DUF1269 domain-containing protein [Spongiactinospora sp. TRM90649]MDF5755318.1 DUF1269 domain-containing protein [Spongiactinospora sp. TRM90649]